MTASELPVRRDNTSLLLGTLGFIVLLVVGLSIVKWFPYWNKAHVVAATHSMGSSIVSGKSTAPPAAGFGAALQYAIAYFKAVWMAIVLALLIGSSVQVFVPRRWLLRMLGARNARSAAIAGALSLGGMM